MEFFFFFPEFQKSQNEHIQTYSQCVLTTTTAARKQTNKQTNRNIPTTPRLSSDVPTPRVFKGFHLSSFRHSLIINPIHLFITLPHRYSQVSWASLGWGWGGAGGVGWGGSLRGEPGQERWILLLFLFYLVLCINVCSPEHRKLVKARLGLCPPYLRKHPASADFPEFHRVKGKKSSEGKQLRPRRWSRLVDVHVFKMT